jgi:type IV secretory pathway TrbD component
MRSPVRRSLLRKITWLGGDRRLVGFAGLLLFCIGWTMFMGYGFFFGLPILLPIGMFFAVIWVARQANDSDPWMIDIVLRQFKYRKYYAPQPDLKTEHPPVRDFI